MNVLASPGGRRRAAAVHPMAAGALAGSGCPDCDSEWPWPGSSPGTSHWHSGTAFTGTPSQAGIQVVWQVLPVSLRGFLATACQWAACSCGGAGQLERRVTVCPGLDSDRLPGSLTSDLLRRAPAGGCRLPSKPEAQELHQCRPDRVLRSNHPPRRRGSGGHRDRPTGGRLCTDTLPEPCATQ